MKSLDEICKIACDVVNTKCIAKHDIDSIHVQGILMILLESFHLHQTLELIHFITIPQYLKL